MGGQMSGGKSLWMSSEVARVVGGRSTRKWRAAGVSIDSRSISARDLFVAIKGPRVDGHDYVAAALANGASAAMVSEVPKGLAPDAPLLIVEDTMAALRALGAAARARTRARVVAVTGSVGKTGTKDALRNVLGRQGLTAASESSYNNHWGVPLSLARMPPAAKYGVFEAGMNHAGELIPLSRLIRPHVAIITAIASAHAAHFASLAEIADAKAEIFVGLEDGVAVINRDSEFFDRMAAAARNSGARRVIGFGEHADAEARLVKCTLGPRSSEVVASIDGRRLSYDISLAGKHWVLNSLAVLAAVAALRANVSEAAAALSDLKPLDGRGRVHRLRIGTGTVTLIDESYNANPASMRAAIETLARISPARRGRRIAVIGEMRELGPRSPEFHAELAAPIAAGGIDLVFAAGEDTRHLFAALPPERRAEHAATSDILADAVLAAVRPGDVVMVKGSNASRMGEIVRRLRAAAATGAARRQKGKAA
jgi:UDP-N-acetylmuramoyl-tripeptide--D-alanyl-D-alanine ligase